MNNRDFEDSVIFDGRLPACWLADAVATYQREALVWGRETAIEAVCEGFELSAAYEAEFINAISN